MNDKLILIVREILNESRDKSNFITKQQFATEVKRIEGLFKRAARSEKVKFGRIDIEKDRDGQLATVDIKINNESGGYIQVQQGDQYGGDNTSLGWDANNVFEDYGDPIRSLKKISIKHVEELISEVVGSFGANTITKQQFEAEVKRIEGLFKRAAKGSRVKREKTEHNTQSRGQYFSSPIMVDNKRFLIQVRQGLSYVSNGGSSVLVRLDGINEFVGSNPDPIKDLRQISSSFIKSLLDWLNS